MRRFTFSIILLAFMTCSHCQQVYDLDLKKELVIGSIAAGSFGLNLILEDRITLYDEAGINALDASSINKFDRGAIFNKDDAAARNSDYLWYSSYALPVLFLSSEKTRKDFPKLLVLWGEVAALSGGLNLLTTSFSDRTRPFVYNPDVDLERKITKGAKRSFYSGHTSSTAANTFYMGKVFSDYFPESKWKVIVWTIAAAIPAVTGYLRVKSGRHFKTDVITGYAIGASIGYFIPVLHKSTSVNNLSFSGGLDSFKFMVQF